MKTLQIIWTISLILFATHLSADDYQQSGLQALSSWTNQSGSTLTIESIASNGLLSGTYVNRNPNYGCQNISYPVTGWIYGTAITFTTIWQSPSESCNSITAWSGFYYAGQIQTLWQLTINGSSSTSQIITGSDIFSPSSVVRDSLILDEDGK